MTVNLVLVVIVLWFVAIPLFVFMLAFGARVLARRRRLEARGRVPSACAETRQPLRVARYDRRRSPVSGLARRVASRPAQRR